MSWIPNYVLAQPIIKTRQHVRHARTDVLLLNKGTKFSIMSFRVIFNLVFTRLVVMTLQVGLSLHCVRTSHDRAALRSVLFFIFLVKLSLCNVVSLDAGVTAVIFVLTRERPLAHTHLYKNVS